MLGFCAHPPTSGCSSVLPSAVCEGRGGETRFAMNHKTQLQFNLGVAPNHAKLATSFQPSQPSPVMIHKTAVETLGMSNTPMRHFKAVSPNKLAMAMKLAKRNARVQSTPTLCDKRVHYDEDYSDEDEESYSKVELNPCHMASHEDSKYQDVQGRLQNVRKPCPPSESIARELGQLQLELDRRIENLRRTEDRKGKGPAVSRPGVGARVVGGAGGRAGVGVVGKTGARAVRRVAGVKVVNERVCWEELDEQEEREQQRRGEQLTRNTRMMYDLSQQVRVQIPPL